MRKPLSLPRAEATERSIDAAPVPVPAEPAGFATEQCRAWLTWSAAQIEACLDGDVQASSQLVVSVSEALRPAAECSPATADEKMAAVIVAVQSHDRLTQTLHHVVLALRALHEHLGDSRRVRSAESWRALRDAQFRAFSMREERALFTALVAQHDERSPEGESGAQCAVDLFSDDVGSAA